MPLQDATRFAVGSNIRAPNATCGWCSRFWVPVGLCPCSSGLLTSRFIFVINPTSISKVNSESFPKPASHGPLVLRQLLLSWCIRTHPHPTSDSLRDLSHPLFLGCGCRKQPLSSEPSQYLSRGLRHLFFLPSPLTVATWINVLIPRVRPTHSLQFSCDISCGPQNTCCCLQCLDLRSCQRPFPWFFAPTGSLSR